MSDYSCLSKCGECTLTGAKVLPYIPLDPAAKVLLIGQAPGKTEVVTGMPFTGSAGKMLYACLKGAGIDKRRVWISNLVLCYPGADKKGNDLEPTPREIQNCLPRLKQEILEFKPALIVALGNPSAYTLTGKDRILSLRGSFFPLRPEFDWECPVLCCLHPSFILRQRQWVEQATKDFQEVNRFIMGDTLPNQEEEYEFLMDPSLWELQEYLGRTSLWAFDTETTGLNVRRDKVIGMSFSNSRNSAAALLLKDHDPRLDYIKTMLEDPQQRKVTQNGSYDCEILFNSLDIKVRGMQYDTRLAEQMLNSDMPTGLDHLRAVYTKIKPYKPSKKEMKEVHLWGKERMLQYANWDAVCTYQVMLEQLKILGEGQTWLLENLLLPIVPVLNEMERKGVALDINLLAGMYGNNFPRLEALEKEIATRMGISPHSPKQVMEYFQLSSSDRDTLEYYIQRGDHRSEEMELILSARDIQKESSTYLKGMYDRAEDGRIHTSYMLDGTGTGRLSSRNPNLQNVPKYLRELFIADEGYYLVSCDYKQLELWVGAILAPCPTLLNDLKDGVDVHNKIAEEIRPYVKEALLPKIRVTAKAVVFGTFYGRSARSIAIQFGVPVSTAEEWQAICFSSYPGLLKYIKDRHYDYNSTKTVRSAWGRHRVVSSPTQAFNMPVQSSASDVTLSSLLEMAKAGFDLRLTVHDEIVFQVRKEDLEREVDRARALVSRPIEVLGGNCFPADFKYGVNWYNLDKC
jgi:DNA polymerase-1